VLSDSREGRRKKEPESPDPKAFERFEALAKKVLSPSTRRRPKGNAKKRTRRGS
jgi:hypothetical protein